MPEPYGFSLNLTMRSGIPQVPALVKLAGQNVIRRTTAQIMREVIQRWSWVDRAPLRERFSAYRMEGTVEAGSRKYFYPAFIEWGTVYQTPRPAMTPAAVRAAASLERVALEELSRMHPKLVDVRRNV